jgi:hypothetical protein
MSLVRGLSAGADHTLQILVADEDGAPQNMIGWSLEWIMRSLSANGDGTAQVTKTSTLGQITIASDGGVSNRADVSILRADTVALVPAKYHGTLWRTNAGASTVLWSEPLELSHPDRRFDTGDITPTPATSLAPIALSGSGADLLAGSVTASKMAGFLPVTVSPIGLANGASTANNGCPFGPDTPGTTTSGIMEAFNSLADVNVYDGGGNLVAGKCGAVKLLRGVFNTTSRITCPPGVVSFRGAGASTWVFVTTIPSPTTDLGGSQIVGAASLASTGVFSCPADSFGYPLTKLDMGDMEIRIVSPASAQTTATPAVASWAGFCEGRVDNVTVGEIRSTGGVGGNMYGMADFSFGAATDDKTITNVAGIGGNWGVRIQGTHVTATNIHGGFTSNNINSFSHGLEIGHGPGVKLINLHAFSTNYGVQWNSYAFGGVYAIGKVDGIHFESVANYMLFPGGAVGTVILEQPVWDVVGVDPRTNILAVLGGNAYNVSTRTGMAVLTRDEVDTQGTYAGRHVTPANGTVTAGASPFTFGAQPFDCIYTCTTVGGMTALSLNGVATAVAANIPIFVRASSTLIATWATTAPTFTVCPC